MVVELSILVKYWAEGASMGLAIAHTAAATLPLPAVMDSVGGTSKSLARTC